MIHDALKWSYERKMKSSLCLNMVREASAGIQACVFVVFRAIFSLHPQEASIRATVMPSS